MAPPWQHSLSGYYYQENKKTIFWPWANKQDRAKLDERQKAVRQRVMDRAYWWVPLMALLTSMSHHNSERHLTQIFVWVVASWYFFLPAVIGAFQKDI